MDQGTDWAGHFRSWAQYGEWATKRLLNVLETVSDQDCRSDAGLFFKSIHGTLHHLLVGEYQLWQRRFVEGVSPRVALDAEVEPDRKALALKLLQGAQSWLPVIERWPEQRYAGVLSYTTMRGLDATLPFAMTLTHVFNHGTHHRGQVTAAMTRLGYPCPELDMVYWLQGQPAISE